MLLLLLLSTAAFAAGLCEHHTEHTEGCNYSEDEGTPCTYDCPICAEVELGGGNVNAPNSQMIEIEVEGEMNWADLETVINKAIEDNPDAEVKIVGKDSEAVIILKGLTTDVDGLAQMKAIVLQSNTTFENVRLRIVAATAQDPHIAIFANGHDLYIADSVKTEYSGDYAKNVYIFGGANAEDTENTHIEINGGDWSRIYGGSYKGSSGNTYVHVADDAAVLSVYGGCYGGVTTGDIYVEFGANRAYFSDKPYSNYRLAYVIGSGHDIQNKAQIANVTGEKIEIKILSGALLSTVYGGLNSMINSNDVYVTVEEGAVIKDTVSGGATTSSAEQWSLATGYWPGKTQYTANSDIHVLFNGEGRADAAKIYSSSVIGGGVWGDVAGNIHVTVNGNTEYVYGGSLSGDVAGNIEITINGGVYAGGHNADMEIGNVADWYGGTVTSGCMQGTVDGDITTTIGRDAKVHAVVGGGDNGGVTGNTRVHVYGTILKQNYESSNRYLRYAGCVFGGGYIDSLEYLESADILGKANVCIYEGADVQGDVYGGGIYGRCSGGSSVIVSGNVQGNVYGGGWVADGDNKGMSNGEFIRLGYTQNTYVELNGNAKADNVYGGGRTADILGGSTVVLKDNARVNNVYGTGNAFSSYYNYGTLKEIGPVVTETTENVVIQIRNRAIVADTIYGYELIEVDEQEQKNLTGSAKVFFDGSTGSFKRVVNADLVQVTNGSDTTIDNAGLDDKQLVNVADLTIDNEGTLHLLANAHILRNYSGDSGQTGALAINAGKCLTADGTVSNLTDISIVKTDEADAAEWQVYVVSGKGSTTDDGDFEWVDVRNGVALAWNANNDGTTQWWLVKAPNLTVTFVENGGSDVEDQEVEYGGKATEPTTTRGGYIFTGWYSDEDLTVKYDFDSPVTENITLYAGWSKHPGSTTYYILYYESNGGTEYGDERYAAGTNVSLDKVPTREGYVFTGWYADKELTEQITSIKMTSSKTVYAGWRAAAVPGMLNGEDHFAYVIGYPDGTVRPDASISRAETATIFFRLLKAVVRDGSLTSSSAFADMTEGMWCNTAISTMAELGIVKGRGSDAFAPNAPITRAEFAAICARFDTGLTEGDSDFTDIAGHWAQAEIARAVSLGWIRGYEDGTFRPDQLITRAEAMTIINRVLCRIPAEEGDPLAGMNTWPDNQPGAWHYLAVQEATNSHDFKRKGEIHEHWTGLTADPDWTRYEN